MELERTRKCAHLKLKVSFATRFGCARTSVVPTKQSAGLLHATPNATPTMAAMSNVCTLIAIVIGIAPTTMNVERQSALVSSAPAIVTGRTTIATISPKNLGYDKPRSNGNVLCPIHSFLDKTVKHLWADCSKKPANKKKPAS